MKKVYYVGFDIAKNVFQVFLADQTGRQIANKKLKRERIIEFFTNLEACMVGIEACGSAHYWARTLHSLGHQVRLIQPIRVKAFLGQRNKTDAADAKAICEALMHPGTVFVAVKTEPQQDIDHLLGVRERLVDNLVELINQTRSYLYERGIIIPQGREKCQNMLKDILAGHRDNFSDIFQMAMTGNMIEIQELNEKIERLDKKITTIINNDVTCKKLLTIPGIGPITACALVSHIGDPGKFKNGRQMSAYFGITPKEYSSGGKQKMPGISKHGNKRIRTLLVIAARAVITGLSRRKRDENGRPVNLSNFDSWILRLLARIGTYKTAVALANKIARIAWRLLSKNEVFNPFKATVIKEA